MTSSHSAVFFTLRSNPGLAERLFQFRHELFVQELGWSLPGIGGQERDEFDRHDAVYCCLRSGNRIVGCFRAISCDRPYLAREIFPHMARAMPYPVTDQYQEISRLGVLTSHRQASLELYSLMLRFAIGRKVRALVALADLAHERLLNRIGFNTVRYGDTQIVGFREDGRWLLAVAGEIQIPDSPLGAVDRLVNLTRNMDIDDEAHVLGRERLSA